MATHSSVLAWRIPGTGEPGRLPSVGSHRIGHNWSDLAAAAAMKNRKKAKEKKADRQGIRAKEQESERSTFRRAPELTGKMKLRVSQEMVKDREAWPAAVHGVEKTWTGLRD